MNNFYIEIAGIKIKIKNTNLVANEIIKDLKAIKHENDSEYDICLEIKDDKLKNYQATVFSAKGSMNFNKNEYFVDYLSDVNYIVKNLFTNEAIEIQINCSKSSLKKKVKQLYSSKTIMSKNTILSYALFWYVLHMALLKEEKSFLHAGIVDLNGKATIITGTGGCGKTSTLFKILEDSNSKYIAEDFGIIDKEGFTYYNPKPVSIYASDMEFGQNILKNYFIKFSNKEKIIWSLKRNILKINPMIKAVPSLLMNNRISQKSKIENVIYFVRNNNEVISMQNINKNDLAERVLDASMRELKTLNELILLMRANAPIEYNIPSFEDIRMQAKDIYMNAFEETNNKIIYIPHKTKPDDLVGYLKENGLI